MKKIINAEESIASLLILAVTFLTLLQVVMRHIFTIPFPWVEEVSRYLMIFMVFIGSAVALYKREHLNIELLEMVVKDKGMRAISNSQQFVVIVFVVILTIVSFQFLLNQIEIGQKSPALQILMAWPMSAIFIGGLLMTINGIGSIYKDFEIKKGG